jgi:hypothetical protein
MTRTRASALLRPLGRYLRDSNDGATSLLAMHRLVSGAAFLSPLWTRPGTELLMRRRRPSPISPASRA